MSFVSNRGGYRIVNHPSQTRKRGAVDSVDTRATPMALFRGIEARFGVFDLDAAADENNHKAARWYDISDDGLALPWKGRVWCNPPYSGCAAWVAKAWAEYRAGRAELIVMLLPANRTEQAWWQDHIEPYRDQPGSGLRVEFLRGRLHFERTSAESTDAKTGHAPFGCVLIIWGSPSDVPT